MNPNNKAVRCREKSKIFLAPERNPKKDFLGCDKSQQLIEEIGFKWGYNYTDLECMQFIEKALSKSKEQIEERIKEAVDEENMAWLKQNKDDNKEWKKKINKLEDQLQTKEKQIEELKERLKDQENAYIEELEDCELEYANLKHQLHSETNRRTSKVSGVPLGQTQRDDMLKQSLAQRNAVFKEIEKIMTKLEIQAAFKYQKNILLTPKMGAYHSAMNDLRLKIKITDWEHLTQKNK